MKMALESVHQCSLIFCILLQLFANCLSISVDQALINSQIVPEIIDIPPKELVQIEFPSGVTAELGNKLTPTDTQGLPKLTWNADPNKYYTLIMVDPDVPSRDNHGVADWNHWLVGNIPGNDLNNGEIMADYIPSSPPKGTGFHRKVFLIYEQPGGKIEFHEPFLPSTSVNGRSNFFTRDFAKKYNLGDAIAGNYFESEFDDLVPKLHADIGYVD